MTSVASKHSDPTRPTSCTGTESPGDSVGFTSDRGNFTFNVRPARSIEVVAGSAATPFSSSDTTSTSAAVSGAMGSMYAVIHRSLDTRFSSSGLIWRPTVVVDGAQAPAPSSAKDRTQTDLPPT